MKRRLGVLAVALLLPMTACSGPSDASPSPSTSPTPERDFTVTMTDRPTAYDPAAATSGSDAVVALNAFQRLMIFHSGNGELKPDAAKDCLYTSATVYECELKEKLTFSNGKRVTAADVKFSIERAYRLSVPGSSTSLLDSLQRVEQVNDRTVRFHLKFADTQFGRALATPSASIVERHSYNPDAIRPMNQLPVGSGPFKMTAGDDKALTFELNEHYEGATKAELPKVRVVFAANSAAVEQVMADGNTDVVWRSLDAVALQRLEAEMASTGDYRTKQKLGKHTLPGLRSLRLMWNPESAAGAKADVRWAVAKALQADRSSSSLIPPKLGGSVPSFPVGGTPTVKAPKGHRLKLTLSYSATGPDQADVAGIIRDRLENKAGISVQLKPDSAEADIRLTDQPAWVNTEFGWLQTYLDHPLPGSADKLQRLLRGARMTSDPNTRKALLSEIQYQAAADLTVLPVRSGDEILFIHEQVYTVGDNHGPGGQLGLWGFRRHT